MPLSPVEPATGPPLPGRLAAARRPARPGGAVDPANPATFYLEAAAAGQEGPDGYALEVVYDCRPLPGRPRATDNTPGAFEALRARVDAAWKATPRGGDAVCPALRARAEAVRAAGGRAPAVRVEREEVET